NYLGNTNSRIVAPYSDLNLGVTNGSLTVSNLLPPQIPGWTGVPSPPAPNAVFGFSFTPMGGVQAFSGSYFFLAADCNTNDVRTLMVNSALQPIFSAKQKDVKLHAVNELVVSDRLDVYNSFSSDTTDLTITTNANSAYSLIGGVNLFNQNIFLSASLPNL